VGVKRVEIEIEELVLNGFAPADRLHIAESIKGELVRLIGERGVEELAGRRAAVAKLDAGSFHVAPNANAEGIGKQAARSVEGALARKAGRR
jgi:hypothetical protein